jgi:hypothetical protein
MDITKTTTITWASEEDQANESLHEARVLKVIELAGQGKTDPHNFLKVDEVTTIRYWTDQSSAEEFVAFMTEHAAINNCVIVSAVIEDYSAPV